jgi:hypothetical protein
MEAITLDECILGDGTRALPSISVKIKSGCSWKIGKQPTVSGGRAPARSPVVDLEEQTGIDAAPLIRRVDWEARTKMDAAPYRSCFVL